MLERAQDLTTGFAEAHRSLGQAYLLQGKTRKAQGQLDTLERINQQDASLPTPQSKQSINQSINQSIKNATTLIATQQANTRAKCQFEPQASQK